MEQSLFIIRNMSRVKKIKIGYYVKIFGEGCGTEEKIKKWFVICYHHHGKVEEKDQDHHRPQ
jgi:hypothetical protein